MSIQLTDGRYVSEEDAYARRLVARRSDLPCRFCATTTRVVEVDASDEEYLSLFCCAPCFSKLVEALYT